MFIFILILSRITKVVDPLIMISIVATLFTDRFGPEVLGNAATTVGKMALQWLHTTTQTTEHLHFNYSLNK